MFVGFGLFYWAHHPSTSLATCAYGDSNCSLAAATWSLAAFAFLSFIAAIEAVIWTKNLFFIEVQPRLGQSECKKRGPAHPSDIEIFVMADSAILIDSRPIGFNRATLPREYRSHHVAFTNLGRTALTNVSVKMCLPDQGRADYGVDLGNILRDGEAHVAIYIALNLGRLEVKWDGAAQDGKVIPLYAKSPLDADEFYPYGTEELELPLSDDPLP